MRRWTIFWRWRTNAGKLSVCAAAYIALVLFMVVKAINKLRSIGKKPEEPAEEEAPAPTSEELLTEIRDLLKDKQ